MKKIPKDKRNQLIIVGVVTLAVLGLIYVTLIQRQYDSLAKIDKDKSAADTRLHTIKTAITNTAAIGQQLVESTAALEQTEKDMAFGDLYSWTYDTIRHFKQPYRVEIPEVGQPVKSDMDLLPSFPYKQIKFTVNGTGYYHDLGKFIADFENTFAHARLVNLVIEPVSSLEGNEKLSFKIEIIALVKPNPS
jgi:Tfp pilus assembly protein PilO